MSTTISIQRSITPMIGIFGALTTFLVSAPTLIPRVKTSAPIKNEEVRQALTQPIYREYGRAIELIIAGKNEEAGQILDANSRVSLMITAGGHDEGFMAVHSPTTLLIRLGRLISQKARYLAQSDPQTALLWVARCRTLSEQALRTPNPCLDALLMAHTLDEIANTTELVVLETMGEVERRNRAEGRVTALRAFWQTEMGKSIAAKRSQQRLTGDDTTFGDSAEREFATKLIEQYRRARLRLNIA